MGGGVSDGFPIKLEKKNFIIDVKNGSIKRKIESLVLSEIIKTRRGRRTFASVRKKGY